MAIIKKSLFKTVAFTNTDSKSRLPQLPLLKMVGFARKTYGDAVTLHIIWTHDLTLLVMLNTLGILLPQVLLGRDNAHYAYVVSPMILRLSLSCKPNVTWYYSQGKFSLVGAVVGAAARVTMDERPSHKLGVGARLMENKYGWYKGEVNLLKVGEEEDANKLDKKRLNICAVVMVLIIGTSKLPRTS